MVAVTRVKMGKLGPNPEDWGIEIYDSTGKKIVGADGLGLTVVDEPQVADRAVTNGFYELDTSPAVTTPTVRYTDDGTDDFAIFHEIADVPMYGRAAEIMFNFLVTGSTDIQAEIAYKLSSAADSTFVPMTTMASSSVWLIPGYFYTLVGLYPDGLAEDDWDFALGIDRGISDAGTLGSSFGRGLELRDNRP